MAATGLRHSGEHLIARNRPCEPAKRFPDLADRVCSAKTTSTWRSAAQAMSWTPPPSLALA
jgi:hypothetical protein